MGDSLDVEINALESELEGLDLTNRTPDITTSCCNESNHVHAHELDQFDRNFANLPREIIKLIIRELNIKELISFYSLNTRMAVIGLQELNSGIFVVESGVKPDLFQFLSDPTYTHTPNEYQRLRKKHILYEASKESDDSLITTKDFEMLLSQNQLHPLLFPLFQLKINSMRQKVYYFLFPFVTAFSKLDEIYIFDIRYNRPNFNMENINWKLELPYKMKVHIYKIYNDFVNLYGFKYLKVLQNNFFKNMQSLGCLEMTNYDLHLIQNVQMNESFESLYIEYNEKTKTIPVELLVTAFNLTSVKNFTLIMKQNKLEYWQEVAKRLKSVEYLEVKTNYLHFVCKFKDREIRNLDVMKNERYLPLESLINQNVLQISLADTAEVCYVM